MNWPRATNSNAWLPLESKGLHTLAQALRQLQQALSPHSQTPNADAQVLLAHILGAARSWVIAHPEAELEPELIEAYKSACRRLARGMPLPYELGRWEFYGLDLLVTPAVLIPRPETELLVQSALDWLHNQPDEAWGLDIGSGSGCIAIALAAHHPPLRVIASDISASALQVAAQNVQRHRLGERIHLLQADLLPPLSRPVELICANLPYIPSDTLHELPIYAQEPALALDGGIDGLNTIQRLLAQARPAIRAGGRMLLEIEARQGAAVVAFAREHFPGAQVNLHSDLAGHDRLVSIDI